MKKKQIQAGNEISFKVVALLFGLFMMGYVAGKIFAGNYDVTNEFLIILPALFCLLIEEDSKGDQK
ncbi:hypothetical protein [Streptococcus marmotae]|uniref:hypothetical protein n=1 Tax=Streptococcus marmotae TaxID=1825069 RepID=UPI00082BE0A5|nr:hypothetical protein [Streptococcus marmotae]